MMSAEYPDLAWMPPKSWSNADRGAVQLIVIHTTEGGARGTAAEDGAAYDQKRDDGTSTHYFHDDDSTVQCVRTEDIAFAARTQGNQRGIQHELCTKAGSAVWGDTYHQAMLRRVAKQTARDARKWGIPVRKLSTAQVAQGVKGFCGHVNITDAFPQDGGTHTDPGTNFPWTTFIGMVQAEMEDEDMPSADEVAEAVVKKLDGTKNNVPIPRDKGLIQGFMDKTNKDYAGPSGIRDNLEALVGKVVDEKLAPVIAKLDALAKVPPKA